MSRSRMRLRRLLIRYEFRHRRRILTVGTQLVQSVLVGVIVQFFSVRLLIEWNSGLVILG